ncbi:MAG: DUF1622 domain-containing protein [bacterium]|nr:DUF1622 domain-containing protein [bacterium]
MVEVLETISQGIAVIGVTVLSWGVLISAIRMLAIEVRGVRGADVGLERSELRQSLGYYLGLGLEFLIASDIVESILKPSLQELTHLGVIVVIRTVISFSLNWELSQERKHARERSDPQ